MSSQRMSSQLILYACPTGPLAEQLDDYWSESAKRCGRNGAHDYMPHCSLTGFFEHSSDVISHEVTILDRLYQSLMRSHPNPIASVKALLFRPNWHGLEIESSGLQHLVTQFVRAAEPSADLGKIRPKEWLHLSLAYNFEEIHTDKLRKLAQTLIDPAAPVGWELHFYERLDLRQWRCHGVWELDAVPRLDAALPEPI